jgi:hypothetical protein
MTVFLERHGEAKTIHMISTDDFATDIRKLRNIEPDRRWVIVDIKYSDLC